MRRLIPKSVILRAFISWKQPYIITYFRNIEFLSYLKMNNICLSINDFASAKSPKVFARLFQKNGGVEGQGPALRSATEKSLCLNGQEGQKTVRRTVFRREILAGDSPRIYFFCAYCRMTYTFSTSCNIFVISFCFIPSLCQFDMFESYHHSAFLTHEIPMYSITKAIFYRFSPKNEIKANKLLTFLKFDYIIFEQLLRAISSVG